MGISEFSEFRFRAGVLHALKTACDHTGNTYVTNANLESDVCELLKISVEDMNANNVLNRLVLDSLIKISKLYNVSLDNLVNHSEDEWGITIPPSRGKYFFGAVSVGERGQIVIPKEAREVFNINSGDKLLILGDNERGIAVIHQRHVINFIDMIGIINKENRV